MLPRWGGGAATLACRALLRRPPRGLSSFAAGGGAGLHDLHDPLGGHGGDTGGAAGEARIVQTFRGGTSLVSAAEGGASVLAARAEKGAQGRPGAGGAAAGFPASVGPGYLHYVSWLSLQHAFSAANGVLASSFLLYGVGLGAGAIPTAGALNWVLKDGIGQVGTLLFGRTIAHRFDTECKGWYMAAGGMLNAAVLLEISTAAAAAAGPWQFLALGSLANMLKGLSWMATGSTRSAFNVSFARRDNIADITAKHTSQAICASLVGGTVGMGMAAAIGQDVPTALSLFAVLSCAHLACGYHTVRSIPLDSLSPFRLRLLVGRFLRGREGAAGAGAGAGAVLLPTPAEVASLEPVLPPFPAWAGGGEARGEGEIAVGRDVREVFQGRPAALRAAVATFAGEGYLLLPAPTGGGRVDVIFREGARAGELLQGYLHACIVLHRAVRCDRRGGGGGGGEEGLAAGLRDGVEEARSLIGPLREALRAAGWEGARVNVEPRRGRAKW